MLRLNPYKQTYGAVDNRPQLDSIVFSFNLPCLTSIQPLGSKKSQKSHTVRGQKAVLEGTYSTLKIPGCTTRTRGAPSRRPTPFWTTPQRDSAGFRLSATDTVETNNIEPTKDEYSEVQRGVLLITMPHGHAVRSVRTINSGPPLFHLGRQMYFRIEVWICNMFEVSPVG